MKLFKTVARKTQMTILISDPLKMDFCYKSRCWHLKALCLKNHFSSIYPDCHIDAKVLLYDDSSSEEKILGDPDFVLNFINNIDTKVSFPP
ncbi:hypothetical protein L1987_48906 [Smallanthus sonchifolius]|uniref:Uncharacterized protein n=1 Tax=Smallanthus sonchifolius TaxID=185202 RepID=A0ACB9FSL1_9ASTR|nr:hypothetical protein L1987_48906 [Smallanthus sonchifolius]